uniref:DUF7627 domain-containing protein n=1 Tax=Parascaris univalens TaxID=6257 RepID=A0A915BJX1_PARUN
MSNEETTDAISSTRFPKRDSRQSTSKRDLSATERNRRLLNSIQSTLNAGRSMHRHLDDNATNTLVDSDHLPSSAEDIVAKIAAMSIDRQSSAHDMKRLLLAHDMQKLDDETWSRIGTLLADSVFHDNDAHFAIDMIILIVDHKSVQSSFAERISSEMSSYVLCPEIAKASLPHVVALLLVAQWPRSHSHSNLESNQILYTIISVIKGWIITIVDQVEEDGEMMSRCALGLAGICRSAQRRLWLKWPELVDEIYVAIQNVLTSTLPINKEAKAMLLDVFVQMHLWTTRNAKSLSTTSTQTPI